MIHSITKKYQAGKLAAAIFALAAFAMPAANADGLIPPKVGADYAKARVAQFNADDNELYKGDFPNAAAEKFVLENVPLFDCPDGELKDVYYFRWWSFRKHLSHSPEVGWVITEFMPKVGWGGKYNAIVCPAALQLREARWLRDPKYASQYEDYWCFKEGNRKRAYSSWLATAALDVYSTDGDLDALKKRYRPLKDNFLAWEKSNYDDKLGLFYQVDAKDGMELSASGQLNMGWRGYRATMQSYMASECYSLSKIAAMIGEKSDAELFAKKGDSLKTALNEKLWDASKKFYMVRPKNGMARDFSPHRELHGYTPWYFDFAPREYAEAWKQVLDEQGFKAPFGLMSLERRSPLFQLNYVGHECQWNGPVWPYSTSITLSGMANFLRAGGQNVLTKKDFYDALSTYAKAHHRTREDGKRVFWIDENIHPYTGDWISRTIIKGWIEAGASGGASVVERGKDYNHSFFAELVIRDIVGIMPDGSHRVVIDPLAPDSWKFFALDGVRVLNRNISVLWDKDGSRYGKGRGFAVFVDGREAARADKPQKTEITLK